MRTYLILIRSSICSHCVSRNEVDNKRISQFSWQCKTWEHVVYAVDLVWLSVTTSAEAPDRYGLTTCTVLAASRL